jgi:hypothetical protein
MGSLKLLAEKLIEKKLGQKALNQRYNKIDQIWSAIKESVAALELTNLTTRIYQDGLPVCSRELEIVNDLAKMGSINHQIVQTLLAKGAILMGTECPDLLVEEYQLIKNNYKLANKDEQLLAENEFKALSNSILHKRDNYIAERINNTLRYGEVGILFIGIFHSLTNKIANDIEIFYPIEFNLLK